MGLYDRTGGEVPLTSGVSDPAVRRDLKRIHDLSESQFATGRRNLLHNGCLRISQRGTAAVVAGAGRTFGPFDRWAIREASDGAMTIARFEAGSAPGGIYIKAYTSTTDATLAATDYAVLSQDLEGNDIVGLCYGSEFAEDTVLTFWHAHDVVGEHSVCIRGGGATGPTYVATYTQEVAGTFEKATINIPGCTTGTWTIDDNSRITITFPLYMGSNWLTSNVNQWTTEDVFMSSSSVQYNNTGVANGGLRLSQLQWEIGTEPSRFEVVPYSVELARCQRYFYRITADHANGHIASGHCTSGATTATVTVIHPVPMRSYPTGTYSNVSHFQVWGSSAQTVTSMTVQSTVRVGSGGGTRTTRVDPTTGVAFGIIGGGATLRFASTSGYMDFSAEI